MLGDQSGSCYALRSRRGAEGQGDSGEYRMKTQNVQNVRPSLSQAEGTTRGRVSLEKTASLLCHFGWSLRSRRRHS